MTRRQGKSHFRLWLLVFVAFCLVGVAAITSIGAVVRERQTRAASQARLDLAKLLASQISPTSDAGDVGALQSRAAGIERIYVAQRRAGDFRVVLDSKRGARSPSLGASARDALASGQPILKGGAAYLALRDEQGRVDGVVVIEFAPTKAAPLGIVEAGALGVVLLLGALFALVIVRQVARSNSESWLYGAITSVRIFRATLLELLVSSFVVGTLIFGGGALLERHDIEQGTSLSEARLRVLTDYRDRIMRAATASQRDSGSLNAMADQSRADGLTWLGGPLQSAAQTGGEAWRDTLWQALLAIRQRSDEEQRRQQEDRAQSIQVDERITATLLLSVLISLGALVLVRGAAKQQHDLLVARHDSRRHQVAYEQVAAHLPIGFYTYRDGEVEDSNATWDAMATRQPGEDRTLALERVLPEDDLIAMRHGLYQAQRNKTSFSQQFRLKSSASELRRIETRGVWVDKPDEGIETFLGFFLDVTDLVEVQDELEIKNVEVESKNLMLGKALTDLEDNFEAMVHGLVKAVEAKDPYTAGHSERVMRYCVAIGRELQLPPNELTILERGALVHDVGKIGVPDAVLMKPARLTDEEFAIIQQHPSIGAKMVRGIPVFESCLPIIEWHHERLDGRGYPDGLAGDQIPLLVRISSVADVFDALTSARAYRGAMKTKEAIAILRKDAKNGALDAKIVEILADIVKRDGVLWMTETPIAA